MYLAASASSASSASGQYCQISWTKISATTGCATIAGKVQGGPGVGSTGTTCTPPVRVVVGVVDETEAGGIVVVVIVVGTNEVLSVGPVVPDAEGAIVVGTDGALNVGPVVETEVVTEDVPNVGSSVGAVGVPPLTVGRTSSVATLELVPEAVPPQPDTTSRTAVIIESQ